MRLRSRTATLKGGLRASLTAASMRRSRAPSGGVRVIYYQVCAHAQVRLLLIYGEGVKDDLTAAEKKVLRKLNQGW